MDELANNHEADMCDESASVKEYAAKLAQQKSEANAFKEKMRQFLTTTWQVNAFFVSALPLLPDDAAALRCLTLLPDAA